MEFTCSPCVCVDFLQVPQEKTLSMFTLGALCSFAPCPANPNDTKVQSRQHNGWMDSSIRSQGIDDQLELKSVNQSDDLVLSPQESLYH